MKSSHERSHLFYSKDELFLKWIGLVKHPQVMSCIYITLFLVTMLIISQQVMTLFTSSWFHLFVIIILHIQIRQTEYVNQLDV